MIPHEKIKNSDYLFNRIISERIRDSFEPKYSLLLGAGCSISSGISSASGIIDLLKCICYLRECPVNDDPFLSLRFGKTADFLIEWEERHRNDEQFLDFQKKHEQYLCEMSRSYYDQRIYDTFKYYINSNFPQSAINTNTPSKEIISEIFLQLEEELIQDLLYSYWFNQYSSASEDIHSFLTELMDGKNPSKSYIFLADLMINNMFSVAFTTNFDNLLAEAITWLGVRSKEIYFDTNEIDLSLSKSVPNVIKLHGDYMYNNTKNLASETHNLSDSLRLILNNVLKKCGLIVIGYSGADNSIMSVLEEASQRYSFPLFWCVQDKTLKDENIHWRAKNLIINSSNSYFIPISGFEQLVESLWNNYISYAAKREKREKILLEIDYNSRSNNSSELYDFARLRTSLENIKRLTDEIMRSANLILKNADPVPPPVFSKHEDQNEEA